MKALLEVDEAEFEVGEQGFDFDSLRFVGEEQAREKRFDGVPAAFFGGMSTGALVQ